MNTTLANEDTSDALVHCVTWPSLFISLLFLFPFLLWDRQMENVFAKLTQRISIKSAVSFNHITCSASSELL